MEIFFCRKESVSTRFLQMREGSVERKFFQHHFLVAAHANSLASKAKRLTFNRAKQKQQRFEFQSKLPRRNRRRSLEARGGVFDGACTTPNR